MLGCEQSSVGLLPALTAQRHEVQLWLFGSSCGAVAVAVAVLLAVAVAVAVALASSF